MGGRFRPRQRLGSRAAFDRVFQGGRRLGGRLFLLLAMANGGRRDRLGLTVSRRVGGAVVRNRVRRLLRESFRRTAGAGEGGFDLVLIARPDIVGRTQGEVDREFRDRVRRLRRPAGPARAGRSAAD